jgi:hypothetical protein
MKFKTAISRSLLVMAGVLAGIFAYPTVARTTNALSADSGDELAVCGSAGCQEIIFDLGTGEITYVPFPSSEPSEVPAPEEQIVSEAPAEESPVPSDVAPTDTSSCNPAN